MVIIVTVVVGLLVFVILSFFRESEEYRLNCAYHEAGHAFIINHFGGSVSLVSISYWMFLPTCTFRRQLSSDTWKGILFNYVAGSVAEEMFVPDFYRELHGDSDFNLFCKVLSPICTKEEIDVQWGLAKDEVRKIFAVPENAVKVHRLAHALVKKKITTGDEIREILK